MEQMEAVINEEEKKDVDARKEAIEREKQEQGTWLTIKAYFLSVI